MDENSSENTGENRGVADIQKEMETRRLALLRELEESRNKLKQLLHKDTERPLEGLEPPEPEEDH